MKRIKENELKEIMDNLNNKNLKIEVNGIFKQVIFFQKVQIMFFDKDKNGSISLEEIKIIVINSGGSSNVFNKQFWASSVILSASLII